MTDVMVLCRAIYSRELRRIGRHELRRHGHGIYTYVVKGTSTTLANFGTSSCPLTTLCEANECE